MELPRRPFFEPFWNRPLCDRYQMNDKYRVITAYTAKRNYFLDENDLLVLRTFSQKKPHSGAAPHTRLYSRVDVQRQSRQKLRRLQTNRNDRLEKRNLRSKQAKERWRKLVVNRHSHVIRLLTDNGFPNASNHYCSAVDGFVRNLWRDQEGRYRWNEEDVVRLCCTSHIDYINTYSTNV